MQRAPCTCNHWTVDILASSSLPFTVKGNWSYSWRRKRKPRVLGRGESVSEYWSEGYHSFHGMWYVEYRGLSCTKNSEVKYDWPTEGNQNP